MATPDHPSPELSEEASKGKGVPSTNYAELLEQAKQVETFGSMEIQFGPDSRRIEFETDPDTDEPLAVGYENVTITGLWHLSDSELPGFTDEKKSDFGAYGGGTYVGFGDPKQHGDRVKQLESDQHFRHNITFSGSLVLVPYRSQVLASCIVGEHAESGGYVPDPNGSATPGKRIGQALAHPVDGVMYDGYLFWGETRPGSGLRGEGVILNPEATLTIDDVEAVNPRQS